MPGLFGKKRILLLTTTGRRTGQSRVAILLYVRDGDDYVVIASNGGSSRHPTWYLNLQAEPIGQAQVGKARFAVVACDIVGPVERERVWSTVVAAFRALRRLPGQDDPGNPAGKAQKSSASRALSGAGAT